MRLNFQVADVKKPLMSVKKVCQRGNVVQFGECDKDCFIQNVKTGDKVKLRQNGRGSYVLDVNFVGGARAEITVDSGAEESVCPPWWGREFGLSREGGWMNLSGAGGQNIEHYGQRCVRVESGF